MKRIVLGRSNAGAYEFCKVLTHIVCSSTIQSSSATIARVLKFYLSVFIFISSKCFKFYLNSFWDIF